MVERKEREGERQQIFSQSLLVYLVPTNGLEFCD